MMARPRGPRRSRVVLRLAVGRYMADEPVGVIAKDIGVTQSTVSHWMKKHGKKLGGVKFRLRSQGRRTAEIPNDRDKDICDLWACGVPVSALGVLHGLARQRVDYIIKTWQRRGYVPVPKFQVGDKIYVKASDSVYKILAIYPDGKSARTVLIRERSEGEWVDIKNGPLCDPLEFFYKGTLVTLLSHDGLSSQEANAEAAQAVS